METIIGIFSEGYMMKRLILGITLSISLAASQGLADGASATVSKELSLMYSSLETKVLADAQASFQKNLVQAGIAVKPGMLASFAAIHQQVYSSKKVTIEEVKAAIAKYNVENMSGVQNILKGLQGQAFNSENVGKTSYVTGLASGRQNIPTQRPASIAGSQKSEASLIAKGREYKPSSHVDEFAKAIEGTSNEAQANALAIGLVTSSLATACEGVTEAGCAELARQNAEAYLALHVFPLSGKYGAQALSLLNVGINVDGLQSAKTGIPRMSLHKGLREILKNAKQLSDEASHLGTCGLGRAPELKDNQTYATAI